jgi:hypothetical protein
MTSAFTGVRTTIMAVDSEHAGYCDLDHSDEDGGPDEDHFDTFAKVVELAGTALGFESGRVIHENADETGLSVPQTEPMF